MVAGVRGTSVSVEKEGAIYHLAIPHSISSSAAAIVTCPGGTNTREMSPGDILNSSTGCDGMTPFSLPQLYEDTWIAANTRKDLVYLDTIVASSTRIADEIIATDPIEIGSKR